MEGPSIGSPLTAREREVANLVGLGFTNRQIGLKLSISERTVGAHTQNILNKLGASNRAQIATWSAQAAPEREPPADPPRPPSAAAEASASLAPARRGASPRPRRQRVFWLLAAGSAAVILATIFYGGSRTPVAGTSAVNFGGLFGSSRTPVAGRSPAPVNLGDLVYQAKLAGDGDGFSLRYVIGDPSSSAIRYLPGAVEYAMVVPGGSTGNSLAMPPLARYYAEVKLAVVPGSNVEFWFNFDTPSTYPNGHLLIRLITGAEALQLAYFASNQDFESLGPQVPIPGLQSGREFTISARVDPPQYQVYLDGRSVINLQHTPSPTGQIPGFSIFGNGPGVVRLSSIKVYRLT